MDTLLIILLAFDDRCHPGFDRDCGCRSHLRRMGERGVCVKVRPHGYVVLHGATGCSMVQRCDSETSASRFARDV